MDHTRSNEDLLKVKVALSPGDWHGGDSEWIWAERSSANSAIVRNIPFFAKGISFGDLVRLEYPDGIPTVAGVLKAGGHSTYRIIAFNGKDDDRVKQLLRKLNENGCEFEVATSKLIAIDVLPKADIYKVYDFMSRAEAEGYIDFQEGHCGHELKR